MKIKLIFIFTFTFISVTGFSGSNKTNQNQKKGVNTHMLIKNTLSIGGGEMSSNNYVVTSSIGQIDAGHISTHESNQFIGGILAAPRNNQLFKDSFE